jgi:hypothetical protein
MERGEDELRGWRLEVLENCGSGRCCLIPMLPVNAYRDANSDLLLPASD